MNTTQHASDPQRNITVTASAGSGKTYLLITRLLRLLLADTQPGTILAITFTRKAANEILHRISQRLHSLLSLPEKELQKALHEIGIDPAQPVIARARTLYERLLRSEQPLRITTFHAFCQEILRRFPLEADVPPGFEILESGGLLEKRALDALYSEATLSPDGELAQALEILMQHCGGVTNTGTALKQFLQHRSDWWAFTADHRNPVSHATTTLAKHLKVDSDGPLPEISFFTPQRQTQLQRFAELLRMHSTKNNENHAQLLAQVLDGTIDQCDAKIELIQTIFLTTSGEPRKRKPSNAQNKSMGSAGEEEFLLLHTTLSEALLDLQDQHNRHTLHRGCGAWYLAGNHLLGLFQRLKEEQRLLDFSDLEWRAYRLLNHHYNAHWVQYKLDQRINHLLVDEFQDTNPTQWRLLLPLLEELASGEQQRQRSVFLVGDSKQSIYRFRRADPELFGTAQQWLNRSLDAETCPLDVSWRSAPAIIDFVNRIFESGPLGERLTGFQHHNTHQQQLWGKVELLPLISIESETDEVEEEKAFRNPLHRPRIISASNWQQHYREGCVIAEQISAMINNGTAVEKEGVLQPLQLNDIIILLRNRTHLSAYEAALREQQIAYIGNTKNTILDALEAQDMVALLNTLITPNNNLALAQVLRSPLFNCSDDELMQVATEVAHEPQEKRSWFAALATLQETFTEENPLARAYQMICAWQHDASTLPVHDLLDRVYHQGALLQCYRNAFPPHLHARVESNLTRFIELALEIDSGRYPSLPHFINRLKRLSAHAPDTIDEPATVNRDGAVRIMTIHAAKGLEAPVVFLADSARGSATSRAHQAIINWPSNQPAPSHFLLCGNKQSIDRDTQKLIDNDDHAEAREDANLLYVALTRARQHLIISGSASIKDKSLGWYGAIMRQLSEGEALDEQSGYKTSSGKPQLIDIQPHEMRVGAAPPIPSSDYHDAPPPPLKEALLNPSSVLHTDKHHNQPPLSTTTEEEDQSERGIVIHRILELISATEPTPRDTVKRRITEEYPSTTQTQLDEWFDEACALIEHLKFKALFNPTQYHYAYNEVPIHFKTGGCKVSGIIDRLVISDEYATIIDYKTHRNVGADNITRYAEQYRDQLALYSQGIKKLWPEKTARQLLIFTHGAMAYELQR